MSDFPFPSIPDDSSSGGASSVTIDGQPIATTATLEVGDIEIGAVEIKDATSAFRAVVDSNGFLQVGIDNSNPIPVSLDAQSLPTIAVQVSDGLTGAAVATAAPGASDPGLVVRIAGGAVGGGLTDAQLRATPVPISGAVTVSDGSGPLTVDGTVAITGSVAVTGPLTDAQLRAAAVPVSGTVVTGGLTDAQLRATPVPISGAVTVSDGSGPLTVDGTVAVSGSVAVTGPLTDAQLRATAVPVSGTVATGGLTDTQLRATPVPISGAVTVSDGSGPLTVDGSVAITGSVAVTGPLTDTQLRATPVPVSGTVTATTGGLTDTQLRATPVPVSGPATDTQLRATPLPISGTVTITDGSGPVTVDGTVAISGSVAVTGPLTDTQLRATSVPVTATQAITQDYDTSGATLNQPTSGIVVPSAAGPIAITGDSTNGLDVDVTRITDNRSTATGALGALNAALTLSTVNLASVLFVWPTGGNLSGTITFEGSWDGGTTYKSMDATRIDSTGNTANNATVADQAYAIPVNGMTNIRARVSAYTSGTVTAFLIGSQTPSTVYPVFGQIPSVSTISGSVVPGTAATNLGKADRGTQVAGDTGLVMYGVRKDAGGTLTTADGQYTPLQFDNGGRAVVTVSIVNPGSAASSLGKNEDAAHASSDTGVGVWQVRTDTEAASSGTTGDYEAFHSDNIGRLRTVAAPNPVTATQANVAGSATSVTAIAANAARRGWAITNDSNQIMYVKLGTTASLTSFYEAIPAATATQIFTLESQPGTSYQGDITIIQPSANGNARTTEFVAA